MYKWDIRPNTDLQEGSAMYSVIDLLYQSHHRGSDHHCDLAQVQWLCRQRQVSYLLLFKWLLHSDCID